MNTMKVIIKITDPWELGEFLDWKSLEGSILLLSRSDGESALVKLDDPFTYKNIFCEYLIVSPRHKEGKFDDLIEEQSIFCNLIRISQEQADSKNPFNLSSWRGGIAIIGSIESGHH